MENFIVQNQELINILSGGTLPLFIQFFTKRIEKSKFSAESQKRIKFLISAFFCLLISIPLAYLTGQEIINVFTFVLTSSELAYRLGWSNMSQKQNQNFQF